MSLLGSFRSEQLIQQLVAEKDPTSSGARRLVGKIKKIGPKVIPKAIDALALPKGSCLVDLATGTGDFCRELAEHGFRSVGADFSFGMLASARTTEPLVQGDGMNLPFANGSVDGVTCGFALRNFVDLDQVFSELGRIVRPGGRVALLDASEPGNPVMRVGHGIYFGKVIPFIGGLLSNKQAYGYLPRSLAYLPPRDDMLASLTDAGFDHVTHQQLTFGAAQLITATRRSA